MREKDEYCAKHDLVARLVSRIVLEAKKKGRVREVPDHRNPRLPK